MIETRLISPWEEHAFWLEILQDHAYFVRDHLSSAEQNYVLTAIKFIQSFGMLRERLGQINQNTSTASTELMKFSMDAFRIASDYFQFEGQLQNLRIFNKVNINLTPTYFNGTIGECQEYLRILTYYINGRNFELLSLVDLLNLWLADQLGHAVLARNLLDPVELAILGQIELYTNRFQGYIVQNTQICSMLRFTPPGFPRQQRLARQVGQTTIDMCNFIQETVTLYIKNEVLTRTTLRFLEHHFPETCYFLVKLSYYVPELADYASKCSLEKPSFN